MNAVDFRLAMSALPEPPDTGEMPPHWSYWRRDLWIRGQMVTDSVENFFRWPCVYHTMLVDHFPSRHQLLYLQEDWDRWLPTLQDVISPDESISISNQKNLINQCYHLRKWEQTTGRHVEDLDTILEFGGGYGAMALVCRRLGFKGRYLIHDLPEFALLQRYFLSQMHVHVDHVAAPMRADLTIAAYSLSEIPVSDRAQWMELSDSYLILYSGDWADISNHAWIREVVQDRDDLIWSLERFPSRPDWYAIGYPK